MKCNNNNNTNNSLMKKYNKKCREEKCAERYKRKYNF